MNTFYKNYLKAFYFKKYHEIYLNEIKTTYNNLEKKEYEKEYEKELKNYRLMLEHFSSNINQRINARGYTKINTNKLISEKIVIDGLGLKYNTVYKKDFYYIQKN